MVAPNIFMTVPSGSHLLGTLVQARLQKVEQRGNTCRSETLDNLRATVDALASLSSTCTGVLDDIYSKGEEKDTATVLGEIGNVLEWNELFQHLDIEKTSSDPKFLFRAHRHVGSSPPVFGADLDILFDLKFQRNFSVDAFAAFLTEHLGKLRKEGETGHKVETCFLSLSPSLEWTFHTTGQRSRKSKVEETIGLAIFDTEKLRQTSGLTVFRVSSILDFLHHQGKGRLIPQKLQQWARNCDEYVLMGRVNSNELVRWIPWIELSASGFLASSFHSAYTLAKYCEWRDAEYSERDYDSAEEVCRSVVEFGKIIAGPSAGLLLPIIELILRPGLRFWDWKVKTAAVVEAKIHESINEAILMSISRLEI